MSTERLSVELDQAWFGKVAAGRINYAAFDKPGVYHPVEIWNTHGWTGVGSLIKGYLRGDEIADGVADKKKYVETSRTNFEKQRANLAKKGPEYASWLRDYKTDEAIQTRLEEWAAENDRMDRANSIKSFLANVPSLAGTKPAEYAGKLMLLNGYNQYGSDLKGTLFVKAVERVEVMREITRGSPALAIKLSEMGVTLEDHPDWAGSANATRKALAYLKGQRESILAAKDQKQIEVNKWALEQAEIAIKQALGKYPTADTTKFPPVPWLTIRNWK